jgi:hypothetical protein
MDREEARAQLKILWDSIQTIRIISREVVADVDGRLFRDERHDYTATADGRRRMLIREVTPDPRYLIYHLREDGRKSYQIIAFRDDPDSVDRVIVSNTRGDSASYTGAMSRMMWLILPGGKPLYRHLDEGAEFKASEANPGCFQIDSRYEGKPFLMVVDPKRDWMILRLEHGDGVRVMETTEFDRRSGRFVPSRAVCLETIREGKRRVTVSMEKFSINSEINDDIFKPPTFPVGSVISDVATGRQRVQGGSRARTAVVKRHGTGRNPGPLAPNIEGGSGITAWWPMLLGGAGGALILVGWFIHARRSRQVG